MTAALVASSCCLPRCGGRFFALGFFGLPIKSNPRLAARPASRLVDLFPFNRKQIEEPQRAGKPLHVRAQTVPRKPLTPNAHGLIECPLIEGNHTRQEILNLRSIHKAPLSE